jgi:DNA polymerase III delta subunit
MKPLTPQQSQKAKQHLSQMMEALRQMPPAQRQQAIQQARQRLNPQR